MEPSRDEARPTGMRRFAASVFMALAMVLGGCGSVSGGGSDAEPSGSWEQLPDAPLSPREYAVAVAIGERALVVGGSDASPCSPGADCAIADKPSLSDGAVYNSATGQWQSITDAPVPIQSAQAAVVDSSAYLWVPDTSRPDSGQAFLQYDMHADAWTELPLPPNGEDDYCCNIAAAGDRIVAYPGSDEVGETPDHIFDPATGKWAELPADPLSPTFDRVMVWSGTELILFAHELVPQPGSDRPSLSLVAALDLGTGDWRELPDTGSLGGGGLLVDGRIVDARLGWADGGETNNWGREYPYGGILDPDSGEWTELPNAPDGQDEFSAGLYADDQAYYLADRGWVLDLEAGEWGRIGARPGSTGDPDEPETQGESIAAVGASLFVYGGVRWDDWEDSDPEWLDEAWLWSP